MRSLSSASCVLINPYTFIMVCFHLKLLGTANTRNVFESSHTGRRKTHYPSSLTQLPPNSSAIGSPSVAIVIVHHLNWTLPFKLLCIVHRCRTDSNLCNVYARKHLPCAQYPSVSLLSPYGADTWKNQHLRNRILHATRNFNHSTLHGLYDVVCASRNRTNKNITGQRIPSI